MKRYTGGATLFLSHCLFKFSRDIIYIATKNLTPDLNVNSGIMKSACSPLFLANK